MHAATNARGRVALAGIKAGTHILLVQRLGYAPESAVIEFTSGATVEADFPLQMVAARLDKVEVTGDRQNASLERNGFYERKRMNGFGSFIGEDEIEKRRRRGGTVLDILRMTRGISIEYSSGLPVIYSSRGERAPRAGRRLRLRVDGHLDQARLTGSPAGPNGERERAPGCPPAFRCPCKVSRPISVPTQPPSRR